MGRCMDVCMARCTSGPDTPPPSCCRGLNIIYDTMPFPTDAEFADPASKFHIRAGTNTSVASAAFYRDHVPRVGPTFYCVAATRVVIEDVVGSRFRDFIYFAPGGGQSHVRRVHGWGYGRFVTVEAAEDVFSFDTLRFIVNAGPDGFGDAPPAAACAGQKPEPHACLGNYTVLPALVAVSDGNVGLWLGRCDGYVASDLFMFGVNTAVRLGYAPGRNALRNPVTGALATGRKPGTPQGAQDPATGPWGAVSRLMVDQAVIGVHLVWPNPLTNRFSDVQLHPSFWAGEVVEGVSAGSGSLAAVGREAAVLVEPTHSVASNLGLPPTTMFSNMVVASFNDATNFGAAASTLGHSNGRAFLLAGDGLFEVQQFAMNNERNAGTHLWAATAIATGSLRIRGAVLNYTAADDVVVRF